MKSLHERALDLRFLWHWVQGHPFSLTLQVTHRCTFHCRSCGFWRDPSRAEDELRLEDHAQLAEALAQVGCFVVSLEGGEPLLRDDLETLVAIYERRHHPVLYTNGWHMTPERARSLMKAGLRQVGVSIDFANPEEHDRFRGQPGAWYRAWEAVTFLKAASPARVHVMTLLMAENVRDLDALAAQSAQQRVGHAFTLLSTQGHHRAAEGASLPPREVVASLHQLIRRHPHVHLPRTYLRGMDAFLAGRPLPPCPAGRRMFNVNARGCLSPCIERPSDPSRSVVQRPLRDLVKDLTDQVHGCQACWQLCRGLTQAHDGLGVIFKRFLGR